MRSRRKPRAASTWHQRTACCRAGTSVEEGVLCSLLGHPRPRRVFPAVGRDDGSPRSLRTAPSIWRAVEPAGSGAARSAGSSCCRWSGRAGRSHEMRGVRVICAVFAAMTLVEVLMMVALPPQGNRLVPIEFQWGVGLYMSGALAALGVVAAARFGGRVDDLPAAALARSKRASSERETGAGETLALSRSGVPHRGIRRALASSAANHRAFSSADRARARVCRRNAPLVLAVESCGGTRQLTRDHQSPRRGCVRSHERRRSGARAAGRPRGGGVRELRRSRMPGLHGRRADARLRRRRGRSLGAARPDARATPVEHGTPFDHDLRILFQRAAGRRPHRPPLRFALLAELWRSLGCASRRLRSSSSRHPGWQARSFRTLGSENG